MLNVDDICPGCHVTRLNSNKTIETVEYHEHAKLNDELVMK